MFLQHTFIVFHHHPPIFHNLSSASKHVFARTQPRFLCPWDAAFGKLLRCFRLPGCRSRSMIAMWGNSLMAWALLQWTMDYYWTITGLLLDHDFLVYLLIGSSLDYIGFMMIFKVFFTKTWPGRRFNRSRDCPATFITTSWVSALDEKVKKESHGSC